MKSPFLYAASSAVIHCHPLHSDTSKPQACKTKIHLDACLPFSTTHPVHIYICMAKRLAIFTVRH